jgi:hypothetical protein
MADRDKPYFAPPAKGATPEGEVPTWGEDAQEIAREAGLGSYGADPIEQEQREEPLIESLERADADMVRMRLTVRILGLIVIVLVCALIWVLTGR